MNLNVTVGGSERVYFVDGEVKNPNRFLYSEETTVTKAIVSASGFTDFAKKTTVRLIRSNGTVIKVNCKKALNNPALDPSVYPGDKIVVPRRYF